MAEKPSLFGIILVLAAITANQPFNLKGPLMPLDASESADRLSRWDESGTQFSSRPHSRSRSRRSRSRSNRRRLRNRR